MSYLIFRMHKGAKNIQLLKISEGYLFEIRNETEVLAAIEVNEQEFAKICSLIELFRSEENEFNEMDF